MLSLGRKRGQSIRLAYRGPDGKTRYIYIRINDVGSGGHTRIGIQADKNEVQIDRTELLGADEVPTYFRS